MRGGEVLLLVVAILTVVWLLAHVPAVGRAAEAAGPRACPAGTFLAADGFCTHSYRYTQPTPTR